LIRRFAFRVGACIRTRRCGGVRQPGTAKWRQTSYLSMCRRATGRRSSLAELSATTNGGRS
jgi:hypothetical protein